MGSLGSPVLSSAGSPKTPSASPPPPPHVPLAAGVFSFSTGVWTPTTPAAVAAASLNLTKPCRIALQKLEFSPDYNHKINGSGIQGGIDNGNGKTKKKMGRPRKDLLRDTLLRKSHSHVSHMLVGKGSGRRQAKDKAVKRLSIQKWSIGKRQYLGHDQYLDLDASSSNAVGQERFVEPETATAIPAVPLNSTKIVVPKLERLYLSLLSTLPNEHQFAMNTCLIMSQKIDEPTAVYPSRRELGCRLQFEEYPPLLTALLAHGDVFSECGLRQLFSDTGKGLLLNCSRIWAELLKKAPIDVCRLQCEDYSRQSLHGTTKSFCCRLCVCSTEVDEDQDEDDGLGRDEEEEYGLFVDPQLERGINWFFGVACVLKCASFSDPNAKIMANDDTVKRFLLLAIHSNSVRLAQTATITLANLAPFMKLRPPSDDPITALIMKVVRERLWSVDRFDILYSMETISGLVIYNDRQTLCWDSFEPKIAERFLELLLVEDLLLIVTTLKCLEDIFRLVSQSGSLFASCPGFTKILIRLLSYNMQEVGYKARIGVKVVEWKESPVNSSASARATPKGSGHHGKRRMAKVVKKLPAPVQTSWYVPVPMEDVFPPPVIPGLAPKLLRRHPARPPYPKLSTEENCILPPTGRLDAFAASALNWSSQVSENVRYHITKHQYAEYENALQATAEDEHSCRVLSSDAIRIQSASVLKALAINSVCALEVIRTQHYTFLTELQSLTLVAASPYEVLISELVRLLETEDRPFYQHPKLPA